MKNSEAVLVTGRLSAEDAQLTDLFAEARGVSRSQAVASAVSFYINTKECILCGALNNPEGKICSVCGAKLYSDGEINARGVWGLNGFSRDSEEFKELLSRFPAEYQPLISKFLANGYFPSIELKINRIGGKREYLLRLTFYKDDLKVTPSGEDITTIIPPENIYAFFDSMGDLIYSPSDAEKAGIKWDCAKFRRTDSEHLKKLLYG